MVRRYMTLLMGLLVLTAACSSGGDTKEIAFDYTFDLETETGVWVATGTAVDDGLVCAQATSTEGDFEDENGDLRTFAELDALNQGTEPFTSVDAEHMTCDDGSGAFILRLINQVDPTQNDLHGITATTWTMTGGGGYEGMTGGGDSELPQFPSNHMVLSASGTVTGG